MSTNQPDSTPLGTPGRRRGTLLSPAAVAAGVLAVLALVGAGAWGWSWVADQRDEQALQRAAADLAERWAAGSLEDVAWAPAPPGSAEVAPADAIGVITRRLTSTQQDVPTEVSVVSVRREEAQGAGSAVLAVTWGLDLAGDAGRWTYETTAALVRQDDGQGERWAVRYAPSLVHPDLADGEVLRSQRLAGERGDILGADGQVIVTQRPVVTVGLQPSATTDRASAARRVAAIVGVDPDALARRAAAVRGSAVIDVITLRQDAYDALRERLDGLPGVVATPGERPLAPTATFARALLGSAGPATAEIVEDSEGRVRPADVTGLSGLQRTYDEVLSGSAGIRVVAAAVGDESAASGQSTSADATADRTLYEVTPTDGQSVRLTLDLDVQNAAEAALGAAPKPAALVAIRPTTGEVLAVANGGKDGSGYNRALLGKYPPGSTFKIATTYALLGGGLDPDRTVPCPPAITVNGKTFTNYEDTEFGAIPFRRDFALSCNTAFVSLAGDLPSGDLVSAASALGVGHDAALGVQAFTGDVPTTDDPVEHAASLIGQGKVLASPLTMAGVSAAVAAGKFLPPTLVVEPAVPAQSTTQPLPPVDPDLAATLRTLMREVVTSGTGASLRNVPGPAVAAKTGTAEFGTDTPPRTHAWITGFTPDCAFAVVVEDGGVGGQVAGPLAAEFLSRLASAG